MELFLEVTLKLLSGFGVTCKLFILTLVFSLPLGLLISFGTMSRFKPVSALFRVVVWIVRGVPLMLQVFIVFYVPGFVFGTPIAERFDAALIAFSLNYACYFSEIFRAGIQAVPRGQWEAGAVLGMTKAQVFSRVIFPQVVKRIVPPMGNEIITLVKDMALARVISVVEIIKKAEIILAENAIIWPLFYTAAFYLIFVGALTLLFGYIEKKQSYYKI
ncbi:MAG: amino acid ABC transporter permease [Clostridia bacterium]|nr:amino acid ABC transporter permease [Clostridia bacterium]